jgi:hypothetical protein
VVPEEFGNYAVSSPDIDECLEDRNLCKPFGLCKNRPGSYVCECNYGFILSEDKHSCESKPGCMTQCFLYCNYDKRYVVSFIGCVVVIDSPEALCFSPRS